MNEPQVKMQQEQGQTQEQNETTPDLNLDGELRLSDYIQSAPLDRKGVRKLKESLRKQEENTRAKLAMRLVTFFGSTLAASYLLMGVAAFVPNADRDFIKDTIPNIITVQVGLLGVCLGYYFRDKET